MNGEPAIKVENLYKTFKLPIEKSTSVKSALINFSKGIKGYETQQVLHGLDFEIKKGDFFGVLGRNGSGKSTLLKLLAGIYTPSKGQVQINGSLTPFIELGVGFNMELTGRENVYLNGALLGFNRKEMDGMYDEIVEFAELERFMDQKLKNYSSGMQVRLAFSIAIRSKSEILLLDEVLAVGDSNFQKKCLDVFRRVKEEGRTVVLVTHDMTTVQNFCNNAILINDGKIIAIGDTIAVTKKYNELNIERLDDSTGKQELGGKEKPVNITRVWLEKNKKPTKALTPKDAIDFHIEYQLKKDIKNPVLGVTIKDQVGRPVYAINTKAERVQTGLQKSGSKHHINFKIDNIYSDGNYYIEPAITNEDTTEILDELEEGFLFSISGWSYPAYLTQPKHSIEFTKGTSK